LDISAKGGGVNLVGAYGWGFLGLWWVDDGVTGVAVPARKCFSMFS